MVRKKVESSQHALFIELKRGKTAKKRTCNVFREICGPPQGSEEYGSDYLSGHSAN
ncbi:hypothetical protein KIN20_030406 [Parelaphostrongylus tenuis]|uniref:Uncharacterized protein n=1 Tax=Parelaphostrongylus tenuis TaxID=148309 RepID=A0AAD5R3N7_PARTN|nr:hypothetical protein KIN20_030406 [Parelaphostrongylus tenuis]